MSVPAHERRLCETERRPQENLQKLEAITLSEELSEDTARSVTLWLLDDESIERQEKEGLGQTQVADMFATQLGGVDMIMKAMLSPHGARSYVEAAILLWLDGRAGAPRLLGYGTERPMLLLESLPGCNFLHLLQDEDAPLSLHLQVVHRVAHYLQELHALGFVHNDVAIPNVVVQVTDDHQLLDVHLVEFTVACLSGQSLAMNVDPGAFPCVAPEVARGGASTPAADIFSFGMLLRELSQFNASPEELPPQALEAARLATQEEPQARPNHAALEALLGAAVACQERKEKRKRVKVHHRQNDASSSVESVDDVLQLALFTYHLGWLVELGQLVHASIRLPNYQTRCKRRNFDPYVAYNACLMGFEALMDSFGV
ncbi:uncharacterized protein LOC119592340 [Penaeus monodon]|uniref:uncharacterized protein LOC119592340 n=1 Tax=Penaeus monodon TaxID=6687 RepID=UPI0018A6D708|nr:uncharacterized protein LOC119592340 [Penaeus monodon]